MNDMRDADCLHIALPARPDSLPIVRRAIVDHAERLGIARAGIADLKTVVSEACANVIRHAYEEQDEGGTLEVDLNPDERELSMVVRDFGGGVRPLSSDDLPSLRLGLPIIGALSSSFRLVSVLSGGTEITIRFAYAEAT
jgi:serine/threonine-protein kinase RsbW